VEYETSGLTLQIRRHPETNLNYRDRLRSHYFANNMHEHELEEQTDREISMIFQDHFMHVESCIQ